MEMSRFQWIWKRLYEMVEYCEDQHITSNGEILDAMTEEDFNEILEYVGHVQQLIKEVVEDA